MTKTEAQAMATSLNDNQQYALRRLLENGEFYRQEHGQKRLRADRCRMDYTDRRAISAPTRRALTARGLLTSGYSPNLTPDGVKVARIVFNAWLAGYEERASIPIEEAEGITFKPTTVEEYVAGVIAERERVNREHAELVRRAKRLWRGITTPHPWDEGKTETMASQIKAEFGNDSSRYRRGINFDLEKLVHVGEQIEALRKAAS